MDANTHINKLYQSISSLQEHIGNLQNQADILNNVHQSFNDNLSEGTIHPDTLDKIQSIQNHVIDRSKHLENLISNVLHPDVIENKIKMIKLIHDNKNYIDVNTGD